MIDVTFVTHTTEIPDVYRPLLEPLRDRTRLAIALNSVEIFTGGVVLFVGDLHKAVSRLEREQKHLVFALGRARTVCRDDLEPLQVAGATDAMGELESMAGVRAGLYGRRDLAEKLGLEPAEFPSGTMHYGYLFDPKRELPDLLCDYLIALAEP